MLIIREDVVKAIKKAGFTAGRFTKMKMTDPMMTVKPDETDPGYSCRKTAGIPPHAKSARVSSMPLT